MQDQRAELGSPGSDAPVAVEVPAATVILVRDSAVAGSAPEVMLLRRHTRSQAFAGAFVFPGGKVEASDRDLDPVSWRATDLPQRAEEMGVDDIAGALGFLVAAARETFEEAGVLLATRADGTPLGPAELRSATFLHARRRLASRGDHWQWDGWLRDERLVLDLDLLLFWAWWVTPVHLPYRFDTRFFLATLPDAQSVTHDGVETTEMHWLSAAAALEAHARGEVALRNATKRNLELLASFPTVLEARTAVQRGDVDRRRTQPRVVREDGELRLVHRVGAPPQTEMP